MHDATNTGSGRHGHRQCEMPGPSMDGLVRIKIKPLNNHAKHSNRCIELGDQSNKSVPE